MNILITGSSGQIGTNLALHLQARGDSILGLDKRPNSWTPKIPTELTDLTLPPPTTTLEKIQAFSPAVIIHLAAWAKVHQLVKEPQKALQNVAMTFQTLELARLTKSPIVLGSSREVYGDVLRHVTDESMADFVIAESPYSASKIAAEAFFSSYAKCYQLKTLIFRFSNVYGRYDNDLHRMERVIPLFVKKIANNQPITVFGKDKMLDFTHIDDCIAGITAGIDKLAASQPTTPAPPTELPSPPLASSRTLPTTNPATSTELPGQSLASSRTLPITNPATSTELPGQSLASSRTPHITNHPLPTNTPNSSIENQTINLAYGQGQTLYDLVSLIELALNKTANATYLPSQTGEVTRYVADITKARQLLNYAPQTPLTRGIPQYIQWCKQSGFLPSPPL